jgi:hypothetical protein
MYLARVPPFLHFSQPSGFARSRDLARKFNRLWLHWLRRGTIEELKPTLDLFVG